MKKKKPRKQKPKRYQAPRNERDGNDWRVPRPGTLSRQIYDYMNMGIALPKIAEVLEVDRGTVFVLAHRFRNWRWANARR